MDELERSELANFASKYKSVRFLEIMQRGVVMKAEGRSKTRGRGQRAEGRGQK